MTGGRGAPHFPRLQTTLNPKFTFPHLGQVQSPSFREASFRDLFDPNGPRLSTLVEAINRVEKLGLSAERGFKREKEKERIKRKKEGTFLVKECLGARGLWCL